MRSKTGQLRRTRRYFDKDRDKGNQVSGSFCHRGSSKTRISTYHSVVMICCCSLLGGGWSALGPASSIFATTKRSQPNAHNQGTTPSIHAKAHAESKPINSERGGRCATMRCATASNCFSYALTPFSVGRGGWGLLSASHTNHSTTMILTSPHKCLSHSCLFLFSISRSLISPIFHPIVP